MVSESLPDDWSSEKLDALATIKYGKGLPTKNLTEEGYPVFGANGIIGKYPEFLYEEEQVLISCRGAYSGKINFSPKQCYVTNNSLVLELPEKPQVAKKYLYYTLEAADKSKIVTGSAQPQVTINNAKELIVPVAPRDQQERIVAEIEKQFSRLDEAVASLKRVKANLKRYKAAVLKAAVEGKLTEEWRKQNPDVEPASKLLDRILAERRTKWEEAELAKMKAKGKEPKDDKWKEKYKEPIASGAAPGNSVPDSWVLATVEQLAAVSTGATPLKSNNAYYDNGDIPWITSGALNDNFVKESEEFVTQLALEETNVKLFPANSLLVAMYGEGKTRGKVSELLIEATTNQACVALIFDGLANQFKDYVKLFFQKNYDDLRRLSSGGVQPNLNLGLIKETKVPLPSMSEQLKICGEVEQELSVIAELESQLSADIARAGRLRQSILARAFSDQLI